MTLLKPSEPWAMTAERAAQRSQFGRAAAAELALRTHMEAFARARWPEARICHEMVMGQGRVRADAVAIGTHHIAAFEVKGASAARDTAVVKAGIDVDVAKDSSVFVNYVGEFASGGPDHGVNAGFKLKF